MAASSAMAAEPTWQIEQLPDIHIDGSPARIHTQGLYVTDDHYWVTGRLETKPKRALLLRFARRDLNDYELADITPPNEPLLDHPGGFDRDARGTFWIPVSTSSPRGATIVYGFDVLPDRRLSGALKVRASFRVDDHLGAIACVKNKLLAANWDTRTVYSLSRWGDVLKQQDQREFFSLLPNVHVAVQDWKYDRTDNQLIVGGIDKAAKLPSGRSKAVVAIVPLDKGKVELTRIAAHEDVSRPLTNEGMAVHAGELFLLPEDLGAGAKVLRRKASAVPISRRPR